MLVKELKSWLKNCPDDADIVIEKKIDKHKTLIFPALELRQIAKVDRTGKSRLVISNLLVVNRIEI